MNVLLRGDALDLPTRLAQIPDHVERPWDLIYLDPPFATGLDFTARLVPGQARGQASSHARGRHARMASQANSVTSSASAAATTSTTSTASATSGDLGVAPSPIAYSDRFDDIDAFLDMLLARIEVFRARMSPSGSLWLHLDHRTVHDAKVRCDRLFGRGAFRGEIVWSPGNGARGRGRSVPSTHQTLLIYARDATAKITWNGSDPDLREPYAATSQAMHFQRTDAEGRRYRERIVHGKTYRYFAEQGRLRGSIWTDLPSMVANTPLRSEGTGYPTQKPITLLSRIIRAATMPGQLVVDPMCGSGTTLEAAAALDREFVGNDIGELAHQLACKRLESRGIAFTTQG